MDPVTITVCIGSSCSHKGSTQAIEYLKKYVVKHNLEETITLKATFCLGSCVHGFNIKFNDKIKAFHSIEEFKLHLHNAFSTRISPVA